MAGAGGAQSAKDAAGNDVRASQWLQTHKPSKCPKRLASEHVFKVLGQFAGSEVPGREDLSQSEFPMLFLMQICCACAEDHSLVQGLRGDATYLVVTDAGEIEKYGINGKTIFGCMGLPQIV